MFILKYIFELELFLITKISKLPYNCHLHTERGERKLAILFRTFPQFCWLLTPQPCLEVDEI